MMVSFSVPTIYILGTRTVSNTVNIQPKESLEEIEMDMNNAYESVIIPPSDAAPPVPPVTAERMMVDANDASNVYESVMISDP